MLRILCVALAVASVTLSAHANEDKIYGGARVPTFDEYPGICNTAKLADAVLTPGSNEAGFPTRIRGGTVGVCPNFANSFNLIVWGCGTECQSGAIVDRTDGAIYGIPVASLGYEFRADSALLIVNPDLSIYWTGEIPEWLWREFYEFRNGEFVFVYKDKGAENINIYDTPHPVNPAILEDMSADWCKNRKDEFCGE